MEGVLNQVLERTSTLTRRMDEVEDRARELETVTQRLDLDALARDKTAVALALALKEAKEAVEATARLKGAEEANTWSPFARFGAGLGTVVAVGSLYLQSRR
jgi:hypothetical protein